MAEGPASTTEELYREVIHVREDIQDLRSQIGGIHHRIDETNRRVDETNRRIDETNRSLGAQIHAVHMRLDTHFRWTLTTLVGITGILIAVIKL